MIRRGRPLSRILALGVVGGPPVLALALFASWAVGGWMEAGARINEAERLRHEALARAAQARLYEPLGEAWREYADTELSGFMRTRDAAEAQLTLEARVKDALRRHQAVDPRLTPLAPVREAGVERIGLEVRAQISEAWLADLLTTLEREPPFLFIERLELARAGRPTANAEATRLLLTLRITAFRLREGEG